MSRDSTRNTPLLSEGEPGHSPPARGGVAPKVTGWWERARLQAGVRLSLRMISGFAEATAQRLVAARCERPFDSIEDMARRSQLNRRDLKLLAAAGALQPLAAHRRRAHWEVAGVERITPLLGDAPVRETDPVLAAPTEGEDLVADYASLGLTLGRHPLALLSVSPRLA